MDGDPARRGVTVRLPSALTLRLAVAPTLVAALGWANRWTAEDGFIYFRVVKQIEAGHGPVFNVGQRVETHTDTLWTAVLLVGDLLLPLRLEWVAVVVGLVGAVLGVALAQRAALTWQPEGPGTVVPFGTLAVASIAAFWHFSTGGLDGGLVFGWMGASLWAITRTWPTWRAGERGPRWVPVLLGLGTLCRPDVGLFAVGWLALAVVAVPRPRRRVARGLLVPALAAPLAYELFRAAYYGQLVPNSAVAKEATGFRPRLGLTYLGDLAGTYALPLVGALVLLVLVRTWRDGADRRLVPVVTAGLGVLHGTYIVAIGGDYMHARLLLPSLFAVLASVAVVRIRTRLGVAAVAVLVSWCGLGLVFLRPPDAPANFVLTDLWDMHAVQQIQTSRRNPVTLEDQRESIWGLKAAQLEASRVTRGGTLVLADRTSELDGRYHHPYAVVTDAIGIVAYHQPLDVLVIDQVGLADITIAHTDPLDARAGHVKYADLAYVLARYGAVGEEDGPPGNEPITAAVRYEVERTRQILACPDVRELVAATEGPLDAGRLARNLVGAPRRTLLRYARSPTYLELLACDVRLALGAPPGQRP